MGARPFRRFGMLAALCLTLAGGIGADAAPLISRHRPMILRHIREGAASSLNWSGYAVTGPNGSVQDVKGSWTVPTVTCTNGTQYSSFWVGIDGFNSNTVEQIGTDADCHSGSPAYYAWFEFYPHPMFTINNFEIKPGDVISAEVTYASRQFTVSLHNSRTGQMFSTSTRVSNARRSSAEWVAEAPSSAGGILPLADFGTVSYTANTASVNKTLDAAIGSFTNNYAITMVDASGNVKAQPSPLGTDLSSFSVQWLSAGP